jgi:tetratricopeptide (TPR) repeat protein
MAVEEFFDFNLQVPATAFLFTIFAALTVRLTSGHGDGVVGEGTGRRTRRIAMASALVSAGLIVASATQGQTNYPYNIGTPATPAAARTILLTYPTAWYSHVVASQMFGPCSPRGLEEQSIAVWLDPTNPAVRDAYSENLNCAGRKDEALEQIANSVLFSPLAMTHSYLSPEKVLAATAQERSAVERGFEQAVGRGYPSAVPELASFYALSNRHLEAAELYLKAAGRQHETYKQEEFLIAAGEAFGKAGKSKEARSAFEKATNIVPSDARSYLDLLSVVCGPAKDMEAARSTVETGIGNGVDPIVLYSALAETAKTANRPEVADAALTKIVSYAPTFQNNVRLAEFYLASGKADRAVDTLRRATMIEPDSAEAYVRLAAAEEAAYLYADADRDYSRALSLEPNNPEAKSHYAEFQKRTADKGADAIGDTGN